MKEPIKALFVFPLPQVWGGENVWLEFLARLKRNKISPFVLIFGEGELLKRLEKINVSYSLLPPARIRNIFAYLKNLFLMFRFLKREKFDIINSLGAHLLTALSASILNIPYIVHIHTMHPLPLVDRWILHRTKYIVTVSNFTKEFLIGYKIKPEYIKVIYNGIDIEELEKQVTGLDLRRELGLDEYTQTVCYIGRIVKWKNLEMLIRVIPKIKQNYQGKVKFLFAGDTSKIDIREPDYKDTLLKLAKRLQVRDDIIFTGKREDVADILRNIDIFINPSHLEVCSISILEAMALGKPVIAVRIGGNPEIITEGTGILVEPHDIEGLAKAILNLLGNKEKRIKMGEIARKRIEQFFSIQNNIDRLQEAILCSFRD